MTKQRVVRFGNYTFPIYQSALRDNFKNTVPKLTRLAGMSGSFNEYGRFRAPLEAGKLDFSFHLVSRTREGMEANRDAVEGLVELGLQQFVIQPSDPAADQRFCFATTNNISVGENLAGNTDLIQPVTMVLSTEDPRWISWPSGVYIGDSLTIGDSWVIGGARVTNTSVSNGTTITAINNGTAETPVLIQVMATPGTASLIEIAHLNDIGEAINKWRWVGNLEAGETLIVDSHDPSVYHIDNLIKKRAFHQMTRLVGDGFIVLKPGANTLQVTGAFSSTVRVELDYYDAWR